MGDVLSGFTPGPWDYDAEDFEIYALETFETLELTEPNARLMAAAPDLLEALRGLLAVDAGAGGTRFYAKIAARKAISKATGEAK